METGKFERILLHHILASPLKKPPCFNQGSSEVNAAQPYPLCWVGSFSKNFHSTTPATSFHPFPPVGFWQLPPPGEASITTRNPSFLSPEAAATSLPATTESSVLPEFKSPPAGFFFGPGRKLLESKGEVSQLHCTLKYFFGTMALPTLKQLKRRKMVKKISQPRLGHGRAGQLVICCLHRF